MMFHRVDVYVITLSLFTALASMGAKAPRHFNFPVGENNVFVDDFIIFSCLICQLKVVVRACYGAYFIAHVFENLGPNFVSGRLA